MIVDTTPGEWTHVTRHEGSIVASPSIISNEIRDGTLRGNYSQEEHFKVFHGTSDDKIERDTALSLEVILTTITNTKVEIPDYKTQREERRYGHSTEFGL